MGDWEGLGLCCPRRPPSPGHHRGEEGACRVASLLVATHWVRVQGPPCCSRSPSALTQGGPDRRSCLLLFIAFP